MRLMLRRLLLLVSIAAAAGFSTSASWLSGTGSRAAITSSQRCRGRGSTSVLGRLYMKDWSKRQTLAEKDGGAADKGFESVGLVGDIPVVFEQASVKVQPKKSLWRRVLRRGPSAKAIAAADAINKELPEMEELRTMAFNGQGLSEVAAQAGQFVKYKCKKGECGTCEVRIDGQWVRTCVHKVPHVAKGGELRIFVRPGMVKSKKSTTFFSFTSFLAGFYNNFLGIVGFVREGIKGKKNFQDRISAEEELKAKVAARKAAKAKAAGAGGS